MHPTAGYTTNLRQAHYAVGCANNSEGLLAFHCHFDQGRRPRGEIRPRMSDTSDSRPDVSTPLRSARHDRRYQIPSVLRWGSSGATRPRHSFVVHPHRPVRVRLNFVAFVCPFRAVPFAVLSSLRLCSGQALSGSEGSGRRRERGRDAGGGFSCHARMLRFVQHDKWGFVRRRT